MTLRRLLPPLLALALIAGACAPTTATAISAQGLPRQADGWHGVPLEVERDMPDATLLDTAGDEVDLRAATAGTPTLLFFGYTSCPDICPIHMAVIASAMEQTRVSTDTVQVVFVSVDPNGTRPSGSTSSWRTTTTGSSACTVISTWSPMRSDSSTCPAPSSRAPTRAARAT